MLLGRYKVWERSKRILKLKGYDVRLHVKIQTRRKMMVVKSSMTGSHEKDVEHFFNSENELLMRYPMFISIYSRKEHAYL